MVSNVYPEHLQWHGTLERYREDKLRLLNLPGVRRCVLNALAPEVLAAPRATDDVLLFGEPPGWHVADDGAVTRGDETFGPVPLFGRHNALNVCGALTALEALDVPLPPPDALADFVGLPHRLQVVHEAGGVTWVDDSISTEPNAARFALESFPGRPVVLIGGGFDRGQDYTRARRCPRRPRRPRLRAAHDGGPPGRGGGRQRLTRARPGHRRGAGARGRDARHRRPALPRRAELQLPPQLRGPRRRLRRACSGA